MYKTLVTLALMCASLQAQVTKVSATASTAQFAVSPTQSVNQVIEWNRTLLVIVRTSGAQPGTIHSTRSFAILHAAIYDSVNNIVGQFTPYLVHLADVSPKTSQAAAVDQAAHDVLVSLYPAFQTTLDTELQQDLAQIADGKPKTDAIAVGQTVAAEILAFRANDGSGVTPPPYKPKNVPGYYQLTPPDFTPADFTHWGDVSPFAIVNSREFLPAPPPALTDKEYIQDLAEVQSLGEIDSKTRTQEQTLIGTFWSGKIQNYWNEIAQTAAMAHNLNLEKSARLFALVNFGMADATISFFEAKYIYHFWRPVTAADLTDSDWLPLPTKTGPDPSYPGAHSATSFAAAEALRFYFGDKFTFDVTSEVLAGVKRHFTSFSAAAKEAGISRIYAGQHYRFDHNAGKELGANVAESIVDTILLPK
jgi:membrane-associated phospholipid phosphatase